MNTKIRLFLMLISMIIIHGSFAQNNLLTVEDIAGARSYLLYPEYQQKYKDMMQLQWRPGIDVFTWVKDTNLYQAGVKSKADDKIILNLASLNKILVKANFDRLSYFPGIHWINSDEFWFINNSQILVYNIKKGSVRVGNCCKADADNLDVEPVNLHIAYTLDNNLCISMNPEGTYKVTDNEDKNIVSGQYVSRNEFGSDKGTFWSPKGNYLAFYTKDESKVKEYPIIKTNAKPAGVEMIKYPMAGQESETLTLGVFDIKTKKTTYLKTGAADDKYLTNITWSPDEKLIYIAELNRNQDHMKLNVYNVATGDFIKTLFEEKSDKYVEPLHGPIFFTKGRSEFLWFSKRDGFNHLYRYSLDGELIEKLTDGKFDISSFEGFDETEENVFYIAVDEEFPLQQLIYGINIQSKEVIKLSSSDGMHQMILAPDKAFILDIYSNPSTPEEIVLIDPNGMVIRKVYSCNSPLKNYKLGEIKTGSIKASDGSDLYYRLMLPPDFDPAKKYPAIVYVYGGPHSQMVNNSWLNGARLWMLYMTQQDFIVFTLDNRGTSYRGNKFEQVIHRNLGTIEVEDQLKGAEYLTSLPYVDANRLGVHGWSYGGFMTLSLMLRAPDVFKVGIAGAPVVDWSMYEIMYGERYMDTPKENPEGYKKSNALFYADKLKGKLLVIHGTSDDVVVWQHTLQFIEQCNRKGITIDYHVYPGHKHSVGGADRIHLDKMMSEYFIEHLK